jgi:Aspartyl protease
MPAYDSILFAPPASIARVTLRHPDSGVLRNDVPMLLDTGADVTLLPQNTVIELGVTAQTDKQYELINFEGHSSLASVVRLEIVFLGLTFRGQFLLIQQDWGIIGRYILNAVSLLFDGSHLTWDKNRVIS